MQDNNVTVCGKGLGGGTCSTASGVEIIPPQRVTLAADNDPAQRTTSSFSISDWISRTRGLATRIARMYSWKVKSHSESDKIRFTYVTVRSTTKIHSFSHRSIIKYDSPSQLPINAG